MKYSQFAALAYLCNQAMYRLQELVPEQESASETILGGLQHVAAPWYKTY